MNQGGFGDYVVKHHAFVYPIPDELESKYAGPLNCAGVSLLVLSTPCCLIDSLKVTVYEALISVGTKATDRVGIVGLGALGHLAVMYARAMGCEVTVFSGSENKKADAIALGATEFCVFPAKDGKPDIKAAVNILLLCGGEISDYGPYALENVCSLIELTNLV